MYHGIVLDQEFNNPNYPESLKQFAKRKSSSDGWILYGIEVKDKYLEMTIIDIQMNMKDSKPFYAHLYNNKYLIVIFKKKIFRVTPHISSWEPIIDYGRSLNIPEEQLDFWPNRFQDEIHYFKKKDFLKR